MTFETRLLAVNPLRKGERVGYSATWEAPEDLLLGVAAVVYLIVALVVPERF